MEISMKCPVCGALLQRGALRDRIQYHCRICGGSLVAFSVLRSLCGNQKFADLLWQRSANASESPSRSCPCCRGKMKRTFVASEKGGLELEVCRSCQMVWFDRSELDKAVVPVPQKKEEFPPRAKEILALRQVEQINSADLVSTVVSGGSYEEVPSQVWKYLPGVIGLPVEMEENTERFRFPFITLGLALVCLIVFLCTAAAADSAAVIRQYGFVPADPFREYGATLFASMFLHTTVWHLVGNLYFLLTFGDDVENELGSLKMVWLVFVSELCALLFDGLFRFSSPVPSAGASGFISGIIAFYAITFPWRRLGFYHMGRWWRRCEWISYPAWLLFVVWGVLQVGMVWVFSKETGGTAYAAHIGGALPGVLWALYLRFRAR